MRPELVGDVRGETAPRPKSEGDDDVGDDESVGEAHPWNPIDAECCCCCCCCCCCWWAGNSEMWISGSDANDPPERCAPGTVVCCATALESADEMRNGLRPKEEDDDERKDEDASSPSSSLEGKEAKKGCDVRASSMENWEGDVDDEKGPWRGCC